MALAGCFIRSSAENLIEKRRILLLSGTLPRTFGNGILAFVLIMIVTDGQATASPDVVVRVRRKIVQIRRPTPSIRAIVPIAPQNQTARPSQSHTA